MKRGKPKDYVIRNEIRSILQSHKGAENAISAKDMSETLKQKGLSNSTKSVNLCIAKLCKEERLPIVMNPKRGGGYYWAKTQKEIRDTILSFEKYIQGLQERIEILKDYLIE